MQIINIHEAKTHLSRLIRDVLTGKEIVIGKAGKPLVRLIPYNHNINHRKPGRLKGKIKIYPGFDETPEHIIKTFEGNNETTST